MSPGEPVVLEVLVTGTARGTALLGHCVKTFPFAVTVMSLIKFESKSVNKTFRKLPATGRKVSLEVPLAFEDRRILRELFFSKLSLP